jgi:iron complex outermembrane receptor protein
MLGGTPWKNGTDVYSQHVLNNRRGSGGLNLNYNFNRLNLHGAINYSHTNNKGIGDIYTYMYQDESQANPDTWYILDGRGSRPKWDETLYTNLGADYSLGENSELSANFQYSRRHTGRAAHYKYNTFFSDSPDGDPIPGTLYELYNPNDIHRRGTFQNFSLDYRLNRQDGSLFTASFLYERSNLDQTIENKEFAYVGDELYYDYYSGESGNPVFHSFQRDVTPLDAYRLALSYRKAFENGNSLELGASSQFVRLEGSYEYDTVNTATGQFEGFDYFNNDIDLQRDVYAAYAEYSGTRNRFSYILGLRFEYLDQHMSVSSTRYFEEVYEVFEDIGRDFDETEFEQNKFDLFPSVHLSYQAGERNTLSLAASHRINRPPAKDMAPFLYRRHQEIFEMGDPLLEPEYSWNADLSYERLLGDHNMILTGFVRSATNAIYRVNRLDYGLANEGGVLLRSYTNAGSQLAAGGEAGFNFFLFKRVKLFLGGSLYQFSVESNENLFGDQSKSSSLNWDAKGNLNWEISAPLSLTIDYSYKSPSVTPQGEDLKFQLMNVVLTYAPEKLRGWSFYAKMLDVIGTNQSGGYTGATQGETLVFRRDWVYDYEGQILEAGATFTFNQRQEKAKQKLIGNEYF